jgi:hypothetical protein
VLAALAARFGFLFLAVGAPGLFDTIIKRLIGRARPYVGSHDEPFAYMPFIWRSEYASMPSGHSANVAAAAIAIGALWPKTDRAVASVKADADRLAKIIREIQSSGVASHRGITRALNTRGIVTARGGVWTGDPRWGTKIALALELSVLEAG